MRVEFNFTIERSPTPQPKWHWVCKSTKGMTRFRSYMDYTTKGGAVTSARELMKKLLPGCSHFDESWRETRGHKRKTV